MTNPFRIVGIRQEAVIPHATKPTFTLRGKPVLATMILSIIIVACLCAELIMTHDPTQMYLANYSNSPNATFYFGTDTMGRDIFSMIWYGGRISLVIGVLAAFIGATIGIVYGAISGVAANWLDNLLMRFVELMLSIPAILLVIFLQAIVGKQGIFSMAVIIGCTSWLTIAKIVRTEVRQLRHSDYIIAAKCLGGNFTHILRKHLLPNFLPTILFIIIMNINHAILTESTLSFLGIGLPTNIISWGSMLSLAQNALLTKAWWIIIIPGVFLITTLLCITNIGNYIQQQLHKKQSNL